MTEFTEAERVVMLAALSTAVTQVAPNARGDWERKHLEAAIRKLEAEGGR